MFVINAGRSRNLCPRRRLTCGVSLIQLSYRLGFGNELKSKWASGSLDKLIKRMYSMDGFKMAWASKAVDRHGGTEALPLCGVGAGPM